jgi:hypothetical protein
MTTKKEKTIYELLTDIQQNLKAPKSKFNSFGKYHYRSLEDILEGLKPLLPSGAYVTLNDEIVHIGDRYYLKATASLCYKDNCIAVSAMANEESGKRGGMNAEQLTGAVSSYARKYALNGLFLIDDTKDADAGESAAQKPEKPKNDNRATLQKAVSEVRKLETPEAVADWVKKNPVPNLSDTQAEWYDKEIKKHTATLGGSDENTG